MKKDEPTSPKKNYCPENDCDPTVCGFQWNDFYMCKTCKCEISEALYRKILDRKKWEDDLDTAVEELWDGVP